MIQILFEQIEKVIRDFDTSRLLKLQDYYDGKSEITSREFNDTTKPNNKIVNNYAAYIVDIIQGYFVGKAIQYKSDNPAFTESVQKILDDNDIRTLDMQIAKQVGIKGRCYEVIYLDENSEVQIAKVNAENMIIIYDNSLKPKMVGAVRVWSTEFGQMFQYYGATAIITGKITEKDKEKKLEVIEEQINFFQEIPVIEYSNNEEQSGDFEKVISLIDAYDKSRSDTSNDFEYFTDAYLKMIGCDIDLTADANGIKAMRQNRLLSLPEGASADFLIKNINDVALENHNNRLRRDIHKFSMTPDLTDEAFGGSISGIALQFKLFGLEQIAQAKELYMRQGIRKRLRLITRILELKGKAFDYNDIVITFNRNMPVNTAETIQSMLSLRGLLSDLTILNNLPFVEDAAYEIELRKQEEEMDIDKVTATPIMEEIDDEATIKPDENKEA